MTAATIAAPKPTTRTTPVIAKHLTALRTRLAQPFRAREVARINQGQLTVAGFLANLGADQDTITAIGSQFGKAVAKAYRAKHKTDPAKTGAALVRGQIYRVFAYTWDDLGLLVQVAINNPTTSALIGA